MKILTNRLGQFVVCGLVLTVIFRYVLNLCIETGSKFTPWLCAGIYFCLMYSIGSYFGKKDAMENGIHDIGFRQHLTTYLLCIGIAYAAPYIGLGMENQTHVNMSALFWGIGLFIHFIFFLKAQQKTIKGYAKEELFQ